jgi:hypothetical protein
MQCGSWGAIRRFSIAIATEVARLPEEALTPDGVSQLPYTVQVC